MYIYVSCLLVFLSVIFEIVAVKVYYFSIWNEYTDPRLLYKGYWIMKWFDFRLSEIADDELFEKVFGNPYHVLRNILFVLWTQAEAA